MYSYSSLYFCVILGEHSTYKTGHRPINGNNGAIRSAYLIVNPMYDRLVTLFVHAIIISMQVLLALRCTYKNKPSPSIAARVGVECTVLSTEIHYVSTGIATAVCVPLTRIVRFQSILNKHDIIKASYTDDACVHSFITFRVSRVDHQKCIVVTRVCVSVCPRPHAYNIARTRM